MHGTASPFALHLLRHREIRRRLEELGDRAGLALSGLLVDAPPDEAAEMLFGGLPLDRVMRIAERDRRVRAALRCLRDGFDGWADAA